MRKVVLQVFDYSLDGIIGEEETDFFEFCRAVPDDPAQEAWTLSSLERAELHIMGRVTYQGMAQYFPTAADHPYAEVMSKASKSVFSGTLKTTDWVNSTILSGDTTEEIEKLRREGTGEILAHGGVSFARSLNSSRL
jgi:dihydrofolate reductase